MPVPIICLDEDVRHFAQRFQNLMSKPQYQYFVTVLLGLMLCEGARTLTGLLRQIAAGPSLAGLSRYLAQAPWEAEAVAQRWWKHFQEEMQPLVAADEPRQRMLRPKHRGRPKQPLVTGYLIGDDSTMRHPRRARRWRGWGGIIRPRKTNGLSAIAWSRVCMCSWDGVVRWLHNCTDSKRSVKAKGFRSPARSI